MRLPSLLALPLAGCNIGSYFSPVVSEALLLGTDDGGLAADLEIGGAAAAGASTFLARARSLSEVSANLLDDADLVQIDGIDLPSQGEGLYAVASSDAPDLLYEVGATYTLFVEEEGRDYSVSVEAPPPPSVDPVAGHAPGASLDIDLSGQDYDNAMVIVFDDAGNVTWDDRPQTASDYLDWIGGGAVTTVTVPGEAFPEAASAYVVAVAGFRRAPDANFDRFSPLLSNFAAGAATGLPVTTTAR